MIVADWKPGRVQVRKSRLTDEWLVIYGPGASRRVKYLRWTTAMGDAQLRVRTCRRWLLERTPVRG